MEREKANEIAKEYVESIKSDIIDLELPTLSRHILSLERMIQNGNSRLQENIMTQEQLVLELIRTTYRLLSVVHQLMASKVLIDLLTTHIETDENEDIWVEHVDT
jgi:mRNA-degrading endonuclease HigB of HigAB toxin-antitoxin module